MASVCIRGGLDWILRKISLLKEWSGIGTGCQGSGGVTIPGGVQKNMSIRHFRTWFSRHGGVGLTAGLDDLRGLFQPMIL